MRRRYSAAVACVLSYRIVSSTFRPPGFSRVHAFAFFLTPNRMDYEVQRCTRRCANSGRELADGEMFYSVLLADGHDVRRVDYAAEAWTGPDRSDVLGWWRSQMPSRDQKRARMAPNDVLLGYFHELENSPLEQDTRYVLALLLVRRRVLRLDETEPTPAGGNVLVLYCPREDATYRVADALPDEARVQEIQKRLSELLYADAG